MGGRFEFPDIDWRPPVFSASKSRFQFFCSPIVSLFSPLLFRALLHSKSSLFATFHLLFASGRTLGSFVILSFLVPALAASPDMHFVNRENGQSKHGNAGISRFPPTGLIPR
jgi:hypothetical protein